MKMQFIDLNQELIEMVEEQRVGMNKFIARVIQSKTNTQKKPNENLSCYIDRLSKQHNLTVDIKYHTPEFNFVYNKDGNPHIDSYTPLPDIKVYESL